jgi:hypothetical protein
MLTHRQAVEQAQATADATSTTMVVLRDQRIHELADVSLGELLTTRVVIVPPTGRYPLASATDIIEAELGDDGATEYDFGGQL